jgi:hypothetical protein
MKIDQQVIQEIITSVTPELWTLLLQSIGTVIIALIFYQLLKNVAAYIVLRFDKEFGKNVKVIYNDQPAVVVDVNIRRLTLKLENGNEILIPIIRVGQISWEIIRNGMKEEK